MWRIAIGAIVVAAFGLAASTSGPGVSDPGAFRGVPVQLGAGLGSVWVLTCERGCSSQRSRGELVRVNSWTGKVLWRTSVADPQAFAIAGGAIWVAHLDTSRLTRLDPRTARVTLAVRLTLPRAIAPGDRQFLPFSVAGDAHDLWVSTARGRLDQIDPGSGRVRASWSTPGDVTGPVVVTGGRAWVAASTFGVGRAPAGRGRVAWIPIEVSGQGRIAASQLATGDGLVWVYGPRASSDGGGFYTLTSRAQLVALDQRTGQVVRRLPFPDGSYSLAFGDGGLYAANFQTGRVYRVGRGSSVTTVASLRGPGTLVAVSTGAVWATSGSRLRRIALPVR
jgi:outer membrane protein assembly factor BamB